MDITKTTTAYETWVKEKIPLIDADLRVKHQRMATSDGKVMAKATLEDWKG